MSSPNPSSTPSSTPPPYASSSAPPSVPRIPLISLNTFKLEATQYSGSGPLGSGRQQQAQPSSLTPIMLVHNGKKLVFGRGQLAKMDLKDVIVLLETWCHYLDGPGKCTKGSHLHVILPVSKPDGKKEEECSAMLTNNESWKEVAGQVKTVYFAKAKSETSSEGGSWDTIRLFASRPSFEVLTLVLLFMIVFLLLNVPYIRRY
ncbi:hypothetical protein EST38_g6076 [Candolleomyces aberdarensis]|uniref:Uncharacterized protein n=1 Tax=Candolleomyces aberdarensis TaxID=2316362 RepID=A0A4V1Q3U3_9AGAR|nr:hypothetical protein EST38_g6076 [Candolleomyces aberdarensis]